VEETAVFIWIGAVSIIGLNGFAAGVSAALYIWGKRIRRGGRIMLAAFAAGSIPAAMIAGIGLSEEGFSGEGSMIVVFVFGVFVAVGAVVSLPGAILVARGLERPGDDFKAFE
jgi:peptidoglycan/LPS O-acetylase OafA/YrhL